MNETQPIRLCEWGKAHVDEKAWPHSRRLLVQQAAQNWRKAHRLNALPLEWTGSDGCTLQARQWVGVVEVDGGRIEIYPKTDKAFLQRNQLSAGEAQTTLHVLLQMLEAAHFPGWNEAGQATLERGELAFVDLWAYLFGLHVRDELRRGQVRDYISYEDDLFVVRGRIQLSRQLSRFGDRLDRVACRWDEYSPDIPLLRLLKCAARLLHRRTHHVGTVGLLSDCLLMLDEVQDVSPSVALMQNERPLWARAHARLRPHFELARWILRELGPQTASGQHATWTFFVNMNDVFESFVGAALQDRFSGQVECQQTLGHLISAPSKRHSQIADYVLKSADGVALGDAKWKLAQQAATGGEDGEEESIGTANATLLINPADIRQLTTYAELYRQAKGERVQNLMLFYPAIGLDQSFFWKAWNGADLSLIPVALTGWQQVGDALLLGNSTTETI